MRSVNYATSPLLASKTPPWRSRFAVALVGAAFALLLGRAAWIQLVSSEFYVKQGEKRYAHQLDLPASRGRILDRNGLVLAASVQVPSIWVLPKDFEADAAQRRALCKLLGMSNAELASRLDGNANFAWLRRRVDESLWEQVKALDIKGIYSVSEYRRNYPEGEAAVHVVGFTGSDDRGQEGIELRFERQLEGRDGSRTVVKDRLGRVVEDIGEQTDPANGQDIQLSIDSNIQFYAYQRLRDAVAEHGAKSGSVVVLDARTGEILALANYPSYDPARRINVDSGSIRNRAVTDVYEPGSTMKPFVASLAIETGRVTADTLIDTGPGRYNFGGATITDTHAHGVISVAQIIQMSSNIGITKIAMRMQPRELWEMYTQIGLGQKPQIEFPGAVTGRLRPYKSWRPIEQATMAYGYGLSVSLLQLAHAYTIFARNGDIAPLTILKRDQPVAGVQVFPPAIVARMREILHSVTQPGGTAVKAQAIGYSVGGKTGTARKQEGRGYGRKYLSWFVGIAPISKPRIVVAVMVDEPTKGGTYGGDVAGPVFSAIVPNTLRTLGVAPDIEVKPLIVDPAANDSADF
ncbi:MAG: penicillin-binding protein 2 [Burkholderiales bacterium]|nr:penicillin-binding protein 2 [Burkholderiales bacterium]